MKIIVGLGNPGKEYEKTRHNVGFIVVGEMLKMYNVKFTMYNSGFSFDKKLNAEICKLEKETILLKPQTFMNNSGEAVKKELTNLRIKELTNLWVVHDDLDLELGRIKIDFGGSSGHHGIESIVKEIGSSEFVRFRVGVGRPKTSDDKSCYYRTTKDYLLTNFDKEELLTIDLTIKKTAEEIVFALKFGIEKTMNKFN